MHRLLEKHKNLVWFLVFLLVFVASIDLWAWGSSTPLILGLPWWVWYFIALNIAMSTLLYLYTKEEQQDDD
ncbi:MAG: hypothetical protein DRO11_06865 [Methanobacteriota archaeon]|nr:MAG: hypothetical protein DRO11_06865 [Euryarchaeota archaeon]